MSRQPTSPKHPAHCEACNAAIWFKLIDGPGLKPLRIPLEAQPGEHGTVAASATRHWERGRFLAKDAEPRDGEQRWVNHFDTCSDPDAFRRRRELAAARAERAQRQPQPASTDPTLF